MDSVIREKTGRSSEFSDILQLIETRVVLADTDIVTFLNLNGDADGTYIIEGMLIAGNGNGDNVSLRPNGSDVNCESILLLNTGAVLIPASPAFLFLVDLGGINSFNYFKAELQGSKLGGLRRGGWSTSYRGINVTNIGGQAQFGFADSVTLITSLDVFVEAGTGDGIKAGSTISLWKLKH